MILFAYPEILIFKVLRTSGLISLATQKTPFLNYNITIKHATYIYAINSIRKLVRLAQLIEQ